MSKKLLVVLLSIFLSACGLVSPSTPTLPEKVLPQTTATSTAGPIAATTKIPTTIVPEYTADPNFFRDDFTGLLNPQWSWIREDPQNWSLITIPGSLQIKVEGGYVAAKSNSNLLLRPAPAGDFRIETQINFRPEDNYQFAGLIIYESDANFIQAGRGYCRSFECAGEGLYMNYYKKGVVVKPDFGQSYKEIDPISVRLSRKGDNYTFEASTDGKVWFMIGSHASDIAPLQVGLITGQRLKGNVLPAVFDYFEVRSLP